MSDDEYELHLEAEDVLYGVIILTNWIIRLVIALPILCGLALILKWGMING